MGTLGVDDQRINFALCQGIEKLLRLLGGLVNRATPHPRPRKAGGGCDVTIQDGGMGTVIMVDQKVTSDDL